MNNEKTKAALEAAKKLLRQFQENYGMGLSEAEKDDINIACSQADMALKESVPDTYTANQVQQLILESHRRGFEEGLGKSEQRIISAQPYEIVTDAGVKYSAKGEMQPEANVKITRRLENDTQISQLIKADLNRGVEEIMVAIENIRKQNTGVK